MTFPCRPRERGDPYTAAFIAETEDNSAASLSLLPVVMGPCLRRDDDQTYRFFSFLPFGAAGGRFGGGEGWFCDEG